MQLHLDNNYTPRLVNPHTPPLSFHNGCVAGPLGAAPLVVSLGMGVDSIAMLIGLKRLGIRPCLIVFAYVGNEKPDTYAYIPLLAAWLEKVDFPPITVVQYRPNPGRCQNQPYLTLAGNCLANRTLPSIAYRFRKSCSLKYKGSVIDRSLDIMSLPSSYRAIGYDCSPNEQRRFAHAVTLNGRRLRPDDVFIYPLKAWGWQRSHCIQVIQSEGLPEPPKSSCYFCACMQPDEVNKLPPPLLRQIVILEANASPNLRIIRGLWQEERITDYIRTSGLLPEAEIDALWAAWSGHDRPDNDPTLLADDVLNHESGYSPLAEASLAYLIEEQQRRFPSAITTQKGTITIYGIPPNLTEKLLN